MKFINQDRMISVINSQGYVRSQSDFYNFESFLEVIRNKDVVFHGYSGLWFFRPGNSNFCIRYVAPELRLYVDDAQASIICDIETCIGKKIKFSVGTKFYFFNIIKQNDRRVFRISHSPIREIVVLLPRS